MLIRRVWLGRLPSGLVEASGLSTRATPDASTFGEDQTIASDDPGEMAARIAATGKKSVPTRSTCGYNFPAWRPRRFGSRSPIGSTVVGPLKKIWPSQGRDEPGSVDRCPTTGEVVAAVDVQGDAGDLACIVRQKEAHRGGDVLGFGQPPERERRRPPHQHRIPRRSGSTWSAPARGLPRSHVPLTARSAAIVRVMALRAALAAA